MGKRLTSESGRSDGPGGICGYGAPARRAGSENVSGYAGDLFLNLERGKV